MEERPHAEQATAPFATQGYRRIPLERLSSQRLLDCLTAWKAHCGDRKFPARAAITPRHFKRWLGDIVILCIVEEGRDFKFVIVGENVNAIYGEPFTGKRVSQIGHKMGARLMTLYRAVVRERVPIATEVWIERKGGDHHYRETLNLPLGADDLTVDHIMTAGAFVERDWRYFRSLKSDHLADAALDLCDLKKSGKS